jgi:hypothetical protein
MNLPPTSKIPHAAFLCFLFSLTTLTVHAQDCRGPVFLGAPEYAADRGPSSLAVADFNGDSVKDLVVANLNSHNVSILLGDGVGGFGPPHNFATPSEPTGVAVADFNEDGNLDLAVSHISSGNFSVLFGNGGVSFSPSVIVSPGLSGQNPNQIAVGDFNGDGNSDIAASASSFQRILLGDGLGGFTVKQFFVGGWSTSLAVADYNNDGLSDAAFTRDGAGLWALVIVFGNSAGNFSPNTPITLGQSPKSIAAGNFNADGRPDLVIVGQHSEPRVNVFVNDGAGSFSLTADVNVGSELTAVTTADFNGDGLTDVAVALERNLVQILLGNGIGNLGTPTSFGAGVRPTEIVAGDFNADNKVDLITANSVESSNLPPGGNVSVLVGKGTGAFESFRGFAFSFNPNFGFSPRALATGDFNNNGRPDLAIAFSVSPSVAIMLDDGAGGFNSPYAISTVGFASSIAVADFNEDNNLDLVTANENIATVSVYLGNGAGGFSAPVQIGVNQSPLFIAVGDFNGDNNTDWIAAHDYSSPAVVLLGNGAGGFAPPAGGPLPVVRNPTVADFNEDGKSDIASWDSTQNTISILVGDSSGRLNVVSTVSLGAATFEVRQTTADLNGDTHADLLVTNASAHHVTVFLGNGAGGLGAGTDYSTGTQPLGLVVADFDGDGKLDVVTADNGASTVSLFPGDGLGGLGSRLPQRTGVSPVSIVQADFTQDGRPDVAVSGGIGLVFLPNVFTPLPCLSVNDVTVTEGDSGFLNADFTVSLSAPSAQTVRVNYSISAATAAATADYTPILARLAFAPGETSKTVSVPIKGDLFNEIDETFKLVLASPSGAALADGEGLGTILDNDPVPTLSVNDITVTETGFLQWNFTVTLSAPSGKTVTVQHATADGSAIASTQSTSGDYSSRSGTLTIPAGQTSATVGVIVAGDNIFEPDEDFFLNLSNPTNATIADGQGKATIPNDDSVPTLSVQDVFIFTEGNAGTQNAVFIATLSNPTYLPVTFNFATVDDVAKAGSDYTAASGSITIDPGEVSKNISVSVIGDTIDEVDERFYLDIDSAQNATITRARASGFIGDDDGPTISINDVSVDEGQTGQTLATITLTLSAPSVQNISVRVISAPGTAFSPTDFNPVNTTISILAGAASRTFSVVVNGDALVEPNETFYLNLSQPSDAAISDSQGVVTILNDDNTFQFSNAGFSFNEDVGSGVVTVTRTAGAATAATVNYATSDSAGANLCNVNNGIASSRCDYLTTMGTLSFAAGETSKNIPVPIVDDVYDETDETFTVTLSSPSGATLGSKATATLTIADNDATTGSNPVDVSSFFVRQHYVDFLNREPDASGLAYWTGEIENCTPKPGCNEIKRINVSAAFFLSIEFQQTGYLVERLYKSSYGDALGTSNFGPTHQLPVPIVRFEEFLPDTQQLGQGVVVGLPGYEQQLENNKVAFTQAFVIRSRFTTAFPTTLTPAQFVDALFLNAGVSPSLGERASVIAEFGGAGNTDTGARARTLRRVAESSALAEQEKNKAFVLMQYYGYLRRDPNALPDSDYTGYDFWLTKLKEFNGNFVAAEMVRAFISSAEYRQRFGP